MGGFQEPNIHGVTMVSAETIQFAEFCVINLAFEQPESDAQWTPRMKIFMPLACAEYARQIVSAINDVNAEVLAAEAAEEADEEDRDISPFDRWDMERRGVA